MSSAFRRRLLHASVLSSFLAAAGCASPVADENVRATSGASVVGHTWEWLDTDTPDGRIDVARPDRYTMRLKRNGEAQLRFDCNHGGSFYEISDGALSFGPLTATRIPCREGSRGPVYMKQLGAVHGFFTQNGFLYLELPDGSGTMRFRRADAD